MKNLPVFVFPVSLEFYLSARHTHKQLLTLYNPYEFSVSFTVLCTAPHKFSVTDPEGMIAPQSCVDVAVRYTQPSASHCNAIDKFRITMSHKTSNQVVGKRDVLAKFILGEPETVMSDERAENFQPMPIRPGLPSNKYVEQSCSHPSQRTGTPSPIVIVICSLCVLALLMPTSPIAPSPPSTLTGMLPSHWQSRIQLSIHLQLVCAFVLGLLTTILLRI